MQVVMLASAFAHLVEGGEDMFAFGLRMLQWTLGVAIVALVAAIVAALWGGSGQEIGFVDVQPSGTADARVSDASIYEVVGRRNLFGSRIESVLAPPPF